MSPDQPVIGEQPLSPDVGAPTPQSVPPQPAPVVARLPRRRRRVLPPLLISLAGLAAVGVGVAWWLDARDYEATDDAFIDAHMVRVAPQVTGRVATVPVDDNQAVAAGQLLVKIDPAPLRAKLDQAEANQANALGLLAQARAQRVVVEANADQARAQVGVAEANATNAMAGLKRSQSLIAKLAVSQQALDDAVAAARRTSAALIAAQKGLEAAEAQFGVTKSQIDTAEAALRSAAAQAEQARLDLSYTEVTAAEAGTIAHKNVSPGDYVQIGQNLIALVPLKVWITANFKETQLDLMRAGQPVEIHVDAYPGQTFHGHVDSFQRGSGPAFSLLPPENATGNYVKVVQRVPVKIVFDDPPDPGRPLGPGMSAVPRVKVR
jgi:membrane fusion protein (multidrug efflux system)